MRCSRSFPVLLLGLLAAARVGAVGIIKWDPIRNVWVDMATKGVVTVTSNSVTAPVAGQTLATPVVAGSGAAYTQQGEVRPQRASAKDLYPLIIPDAEYFKSCHKNTSDPLSMATTKCDLFKDFVNCQQLADMGYLPPGVQSFVPSGLNGGFSLPNGCSSGNLGIEYDGLKMVFNSPQIPILAVIAKDIPSKVYYFGSGVLQGRLLNILMLKAEFCYAPPSISPLYVSTTASFSTGIQPGTTSWSFFKTAQLAPPFLNNMASMFKGDTADVTWTLSVQKTGTDTVYQGAVSGQVTISNPQNVPVTIYSVNGYVQGGPSATVSCGAPVPMTIQPCSSAMCSYVAYWPVSPTAGTYTGVADVTYSVGDTNVQGNQVGTSIFQVGTISDSIGMINTAVGNIASGQAVIQDNMAPQQFTFSGSQQQTYVTQLTCPETAIVTNQATLMAATGQQIVQTATVQKLCFELQVRVAQAASPFVGKWSWDVKKVASAGAIVLKPSATAWDKYVKQQVDLAIASGQDPSAAMALITGGTNASALSSSTMAGSTTGEVTYTVTYTRTAPGGFVAGAPAFQAVGDVFITNTSPLNAQLKEVTVAITNPFGGLPYSTQATCPMLTVAAGQTLQCRYIATPSFNPVGAQVTATAVYINNRNGVPTGSTTPFSSAAIMVAGADSGGVSGRRLLAAQTGNQSMTLPPLPQLPQLPDPLKVIGNALSGGANNNNKAPTPAPSLPQLPNPLKVIGDALSGGGAAPAQPTPQQALKDLGNLFNGMAKAASALDDTEDLGDSTLPQVVASGSTPAAPAGSAPVMPAAPVAPAVAPATTYDLKGLQDECVEVKDVFATGDGYTTGIITAGTFPAGRICSSTVFTYTVSYGPYGDCWKRKALNQATFMAPDTQTTGSASAPIEVQVQGCGAPVAASTKSYAVWAKKSYTWTVAKSAEPSALQLEQGKAGNVKYSISYKRSPSLVQPKLSATVQFDNLAVSDAVTLTKFSYNVKSRCMDGEQSHTGTFKCAASTIPAGGTPLSCQVVVDLPCAAPGTFLAYATVGNSVVQATPFTFPAPQATDHLTDSECAIVVDEFDQGQGLVQGNITSGMRPYGKLCGSKDFQYTATYGPFSECGRRKASNIASLSTGKPARTEAAEATVVIDVAGCNLYTPLTKIDATRAAAKRVAKPAETPVRVQEEPVSTAAAKLAAQKKAAAASAARLAAAATKNGAKCVSGADFWKACMSSANPTGRCAVVQQLPAGPATAFFPMPNQRTTRTYKAVMTKALPTGNKATDLWFKASQALVAVQLNELAGVVLPAPVKEAVATVSNVVSSTTVTPPVLPTGLPGLPNAITLLEKFSTGQASVPSC